MRTSENIFLLECYCCSMISWCNSDI